MARIPEQVDLPKDVDFPIGSFLLTKTKDALSVNGFDESFFMYFEEADLALRMRKIGRIIYNPTIKVIHLGGQSTLEKELIVSSHFYKSWGVFVKKHKGSLYSTLTKIVLCTVYLLHLIKIKKRSKLEREPFKKRLSNLLRAW